MCINSAGRRTGAGSCAVRGPVTGKVGSCGSCDVGELPDKLAKARDRLIVASDSIQIDQGGQPIDDSKRLRLAAASPTLVNLLVSQFIFFQAIPAIQKKTLTNSSERCARGLSPIPAKFHHSIIAGMRLEGGTQKVRKKMRFKRAQVWPSFYFEHVG